MPKSRNMGRRSHHQQDAELHVEMPATQAADRTDQPTRPTQHPADATHDSGEQPVRNHSRRGE
ncbi:MAG TPA: hypothetical protein VFN56_03365 [Candidatus Saccharimonadales bacterium]|nr:hypothetical protein [Candidatus Saccharimonadales bacterium]